MSYDISTKIIVATILLAVLSTASAKKTSTKTMLDIRKVRSSEQPDSAAHYVLNQQTKTEEEPSAENAQQEQQHIQQQQQYQEVTVVTEDQYETLLKQAQKALQGYDLTKLSAAAHQAVVVPSTEHRIPKVIYKPEVKYVYADAPSAPVSYKAPVAMAYPVPVAVAYTKVPTSVAYNTAPAAYGAYRTQEHTEEHGSVHDHYSKHKFGYRVHDPHTGAAFGHSEVSEGHVTRGHYHVLLPDGRLQNVNYVADPSGYHAKVTYELYKRY